MRVCMVRLIRSVSSKGLNVKYFSQRRRLHLLEVGLYEAARFKVLHVTLNFVKFFFIYQIYLHSSVLCLLFSLENEDL